MLIIGCTGDNDNSIIPEEPVGYDTLIPLNVGNYWLYNLYDLEPDGSGETPEKWVFGFIIDGTMTRFINGDSTICYKLFTCGEDLKPYYDRPLSFEGSKLIYHNRDGTYYSGIERYDTLKLAFNDLIFPYPVEKEEIVDGHVFYYSTLGNFLNVHDDAITQYECISTDSLISTPAGDFNCVVYRMAFVDYPPLFRDEIIFFIKPGLGIVGMVMMVYHYNLNQYRYINKTLLKSYYLNKEEGG
ncbi:MAG: hypothetical protein GXO85_09510, partial [Chlorobi bacterium]|nr:hypothetical protein [Chlorobiota bacterium]